MPEYLIQMSLKDGRSYQNQICEHLIHLIKENYFGDQPLPSSRKLAELLGVSRNTVVLVYERLVDEDYIISRKRSGFFVSDSVKDNGFGNVRPRLYHDGALKGSAAPKWNGRLCRRPADFPRLQKALDWQKYQYPFTYGQVDPSQFPLHQWRECSRHVQARGAIAGWVDDHIDADDQQLVTQIRQQLLTRRGISTTNDNILITLGTQNSLTLLSGLLFQKGTKVGCENPGYSDLRHIVSLAEADVVPLNLDLDGVIPGRQLSGCDYVYLTPSHQYPTTVTLPIGRRKALLQQAAHDDFVIIEDDYESEVNFIESPLPALKSMDDNGRVIYVGSLSKSLSPGLRIGYVVADFELISQMRALRRYSYRHPPTNNQKTLALFIEQGYYDSHVRRMRVLYERKWKAMNNGIDSYLKLCDVYSTPGSFCFWLRLPNGVNAIDVTTRAASEGIVVESGDCLFISRNRHESFIRLGFSAISENNIDQGLRKLGEIISGFC